MDHRSLFLKHIDPKRHIGVEVGALDRPTLSRDDVDVRYLDHLDTDGLRTKYRTHRAISADRIVDISYVWNDGTLAQVVGVGTRFDFFAASHVIEHIANPIGWLNEIHGVLKPGGRLLLFVPDKRFTFDVKRPCTRLSALVDAYFSDRRRPSFGQIYEHYTHAAKVDPSVAWRTPDMAERARILPRHGVPLALDKCRQAQAADAYVDVHCSVFTPYSFVELLRDMVAVGPELLRPFKVVDFVPTPRDDIEFFVALEAIANVAVEAFNDDIMRQIARSADYSGSFDDGGFAEMMHRDEMLRQRYDALLQNWSDSRANGRWKEISAEIMASLPGLDPTLHHEQPGAGAAVGSD